MQTSEAITQDIGSTGARQIKVKKTRRIVRRIGITKSQLVRKVNAWGRKNKDVIKNGTAVEAAAVATSDIGHIVTHAQIKRVRAHLGIHLYATRNHKRSRGVRRASGEPVKKVKKAEKRTATYIKVAKLAQTARTIDSGNLADRVFFNGATRATQVSHVEGRLLRVEKLLSLLYARLGEPLPLHTD